MAETIERYNALWPANSHELSIEMACIRMGGTWKSQSGKDCGAGLAHHYERMRQILWPELDAHRWHILCRDQIIQNKVTVLMGPGSSGKTHEAAWTKLCEYLVFPEDTLILVSSTDIRGLRLRVWGEIVSLWERARDRFPAHVSGHLIDSKLAIATDNVEEEGARDLRKGIIGIPCVQNGKFVGLGKYAGIKQKRIRLIGDECQFMGASFLSAFANLDKNADFRAIILGNPNDPLDQLGKAAEPRDGWGSFMEPEKTVVWETRFFNGRCVNLIGTDSPNFDYPETEPTKFPYLISREKIANTLSFFPKDSFEYQSQCVGSMKTGVLAHRVLTRDICQKFNTHKDVIWDGMKPLTRIYGLDAAYGGDRCVGGFIEFGVDIDGKVKLSVSEPHVIPIRIGTGMTPEDQIAERVRVECEQNGIPPENMFHDATGRGSLGTALARLWSAQTNPIEFGGPASERPVCLDLFIFDTEVHARRLKKCSEHYIKFVTELWFSIRYAVEADQIRNLPEDVMEELCMRKWEFFKDKYVLEPKSGTGTKPGMKERTGRSPDLADWLSICVEGARRKGFNISRLASSEAEAVNTQWVRDIREKQRRLRQSYTLDFTA